MSFVQVEARRQKLVIVIETNALPCGVIYTNHSQTEPIHPTSTSTSSAATDKATPNYLLTTRCKL
jgi:hypothetical protein